MGNSETGRFCSQIWLISISKNKTVIAHAGMKFKIIHFWSFKLDPKSHEMYDYNPTFPVEFSARQGFFNI